ncbi:hypothetical protein AB0M43_34220 [Longispora sp. NPDC051575]|uniref:hypothetical protein n=1 Tax=Longispora sp. NPDC051575 TaxID=3154943 RepID=UPI00342F8618
MLLIDVSQRTHGEPMENARRNPLVRVRVGIGHKEWPGGAPQDLYYIEVTLPYSEANAFREDLREVAAAECPGRHVMQESAGYTSWGGSGGEYLAIALWLTTVPLEIVVHAAYARLRARLAAESAAPAGRQYSRQEATEFARRTVVHEFARLPGSEDSVDAGELEVVSQEHDHDKGSWTVVLRSAEKVHYEVSTVILEGLPVATRTKRTAAESL